MPDFFEPTFTVVPLIRFFFIESSDGLDYALPNGGLLPRMLWPHLLLTACCLLLTAYCLLVTAFWLLPTAFCLHPPPAEDFHTSASTLSPSPFGRP